MSDEKKEPLRLRKLLEVLHAVLDGYGDGADPDVEVWIDEDRMARIETVGRFAFMPTVTLGLGAVEIDFKAGER